MATTMSTASYQQGPPGPDSDGAKIKVTVFEHKSSQGGSGGSSKTGSVFVAPHDTVDAFKKAVFSNLGTPVHLQTAIYKGQVLNDKWTLNTIPGLCGEDGSQPHVRVVVKKTDIEGRTQQDSVYEPTKPLKDSRQPPSGYFQQQSVFRRHSPHTSFTRETPYVFPREVGEETALVRKVYTALSIQMMATAVIGALFMFYEPLNKMVLAAPTTYVYTAMFVGIALLMGLYCFKARHPTNLYLLIGFTLAMSVQIGVICALYQAQGMGELILQAFVYTAAIFGALTIYAFTTRVDVRSWGPYLFVGLVVMVIWGLVSMLFGFQNNWFYSLLGALLFSAYILYDTSRLLHTYGADESWIYFTIDLYLDIINLFLFILQLLASSRRD